MAKEKKKKYYQADQDKLQKKLDQIGSGTYFKPKEGKNIIRILPPWSDSGLWYKEVALHYGLKDESGKDRAFPCLRMFETDCPTCEKRDELLAGNGEDKKLGEKLRARVKFYANILDRKTGKVMIWGFSQKTLGILLSYCSDPDYGDISHPEEGFDIIIERTGTTMTDTKYQIRVRPKASEVDVEGWEDQLHNLDTEVSEEMAYDDLLAIVEANFGKVGKKKSKDDEDEDEDDEDEEEEAPKKKGKKSSKQEDEDEEEEEEKPVKKGKKKPVEEDDDEDDEDEDEKEEEAPKKKSKKGKKDDDDEEEETPKKKSKKSSKKDDDDEEDDDEDEDDDE